MQHSKIRKIGILASILLLISSLTTADRQPTVEEIDRAILWFVKDYPRNPAYDPVYRRQLAESFHSAGFEFELPPLLLTGKAFRESSFRTDVEGFKLGEIGLLQVTNFCIKPCKNHCGELKTVKEQIDCGACCLKNNVDSCGSLYGGISKYACGSCKPKSKKVKNIIDSRINLWHKLRKIVFNENR